MPIYEYECPEHGRFEKYSPNFHEGHTEFYAAPCTVCGEFCNGVMSPVNWSMGWKFLKNQSEKSPAAPSGSQYEPAWDQAYGP